MPLALAAMLPAIISAGAGLAGQGINAAATGLANNKAYKRAQSMRDYDNSYNAPIAQMERLRAAGLNPNMVYGHGNTSIASTGQTSKPDAPQFDLQGIVGQALQAMQTMANTNNLAQVNENLKIQGQGQNLENILRDLKISNLDTVNRYQKPFLEGNLENLKYKNQLTLNQANSTFDENQRRTLLTAQSLREGVNRLLQQDLQRAKTQAETQAIKAQIGILNSESVIKKWEAGLTKSNVSKTDPLYMKWAADLYQWLKK